MERTITDIYDLLMEFMPFFCIPICMMIFSSIVRIVKGIAQGNIEIGEQETERKENVNDKKEKISIDKDLQKYFNYKE